VTKPFEMEMKMKIVAMRFDGVLNGWRVFEGGK
jgi:hypothetical protein